MTPILAEPVSSKDWATRARLRTARPTMENLQISDRVR